MIFTWFWLLMKYIWHGAHLWIIFLWRSITIRTTGSWHTENKFMAMSSWNHTSIVILHDLLGLDVHLGHDVVAVVGLKMLDISDDWIREDNFKEWLTLVTIKPEDITTLTSKHLVRNTYWIKSTLVIPNEAPATSTSLSKSPEMTAVLGTLMSAADQPWNWNSSRLKLIKSKHC